MDSKILQTRRWLWMLLTLLFAFVLPILCSSGVFAADKGAVSFERVSDDAVSASLLPETEDLSTTDVATYRDNETVRVAIYLTAPSTIDLGFSTMSISENKQAMMYSSSLKTNQAMVTNRIEKAIGEDLDVEWNLTLIANIISANVEYGQIEAIEGVSGVEKVVVEQCYYPTVEETNTEAGVSPNMCFSGDMIQLSDSWAADYYGAGSRIAIVDTGLDIDHQSFSAEAYEYALRENAKEKGMSYEDYVESLNLLDKEELDKKKYALHGYSAKNDIDRLYFNTKVPFGVNYPNPGVDDVTHDNDSAGHHGSHVAGIAAANRYIEKDGKMVDALSEAYVAGVAPDAQILAMKVFSGAGAMESDILAGIEDAIILEADTVNLSLGSTNPGFSVTYDILQKVINTDTVIVFSAGNSFYRAYNASSSSFLGEGHLYANDVEMNTLGSPGSATNSFTVASAENIGAVTSGSLQVNGKLIDYNAGNSYPHDVRGLPSLDTTEDGSGTEYDYVLVETYGAEGDFDDIDCKGKIVLVSRGMSINFGVKANNAVAAGAVATIVYNNVEGTLNMNLEGYREEYDEPCVFITKSNAERFKDAGTAHKDSKGNTYYTGKVSVVSGLQVVDKYEGHYNMSSFSSWGVTGDLALKPEITAPGGNIYSVDGSSKTETNRYTLMSGTSMAAPQISGIGALVSDYIKTHDYEGKFANPHRGLIQSLMMSTAVPIKDANGNYYPLMQQGAGMGNAAGATSAKSYIKMDSAATTSYDDGKVKAELGDDPERTGIYAFAFTLYNLTDSKQIYDLSADIFAQNTFEEKARDGGEYTTRYMDNSTRFLSADTTFFVDGKEVTAATLPADGEVVVEVTIKLSDEAKATLDSEFKNGTYMQAYVFVNGRADEEGVAGTAHSIPVFGFYGNWTDPSMFYAGASLEGEALTALGSPTIGDFSREDTFTWNYQGTSIRWYRYNGIYITDTTGGHMLGGNPLVHDATYMPERDAMQRDVKNLSSDTFLARDASYFEAKVTNLTTEKQLFVYRIDGFINGAWLTSSGSEYGYIGTSINIDFLANAEEGDFVRFNFKALPEYYDEGKPGEEAEPGKGAEYGVTVCIDDTLPQVSEISFDDDTDILSVSASDNNYVSAVIAYSADGKEILSYTGSKADIEKGETAVYDVDLSAVEDSDVLVQVFDYAANMATYRVDFSGEEMSLEGAAIAYDRDAASWVQIDKVWDDTKTLSASEKAFSAASAVGNVVMAVTDERELYVIDACDLSDLSFVKTLDYAVTDLAYNSADGNLYGVTDDSKLIRINITDGGCTLLGGIPFRTNTLACDENGTFYSNKYGTGEVYSYSLKTIIAGASFDYDINGDGVVSALDVQTILDYVVNETTPISDKSAADIDGDGDIDTYDAYLLHDTLDAYPVLIATADCVMSKYLQAMEVDPNSGKLYWASYFTDFMKDDPVGFSYFCEIDTESGELIYHQDYWNEMTALVLFDTEISSTLPPIHGIDLQLNLSAEAVSLTPGEEQPLGAGVTPWNVENNDVLWSSSDSSVATVNENGVVTAVGLGECDIIAVAAADQSCSSSCRIRVSEMAEKKTTVSVSELGTDAGGVVDNTSKNAYLSALESTVEFDLTLSADTPVTNGLQTVSFDAGSLKLTGVSSDGMYSYKEDNGKITVSYLPISEVKPGDALVTMKFCGQSCVENDVMIRCLEENDKHISVETLQTLSGHIWSDWTVTTPVSETVDGEEMRNCAICGQTETRVIAATGCPSLKYDDLDVSVDSWYHEGVDYMLRNGYMKGMSESKFMPLDEMTRGQLVTILYRIAGDPSVAGMKNPFCDLTQEWYKNAVIWAASNDIVKGMSDSEFMPELSVSREQIATILYRYSGEAVVSHDALASFRDGIKVSDYAEDAMNWAVGKSLIQGVKVSDGILLEPQGAATRGQISVLLMRYLNK